MTGGTPVRTIRLAQVESDRAAAYRVRFDVFVTEQQVPADLELDELDETADHFVAFDDDRAVGAGRLAVRPETRGTALGVALVAAIEARAAERELRVVALSAQTHALGFYERLGYTAHGPVFDDAGLPHRWMSKLLG